MSKRLISATVLAVMAFGAVALGATRDYDGRIKGDPSAKMSLEVKKRGGELTVTTFSARNFVITCKKEDDARLGKASLTGTAILDEDRRFRLAGENDSQSLSMRGRLVGKRRAKGKFTFAGDVALEGRTVSCESDLLAWRARR